ncbi:MAG: NAD-dependent epimerase/dehydratase family protein [Pyrinomonadaceae bacterium]|nr:NAD-dependent epimerase/dehydratase family protein [Pyrinomonadaceae bacterium]
MKVLVTGGSGYLGTHIKRHFRADDFSRTTDRDLLNLLDTRIASDYDVVIHLAAKLDKDPAETEQVFLNNVGGTVNLLQSIKEGAVFIFASTKDVYGRFAGKYDAVPEDCPTLYTGQSALEWSKLIAERYVEFYGNTRNFRTCIFRLSTVYGPAAAGTSPNFVSHYANLVNTGDPVVFPADGKPVRDFLHVDDFASACSSFIDSVIRHGLYNLGGGPDNALSLRELFEKMQEVSGYQGMVDENNSLPDPVPVNYVSDISLVTRELDWKPEISIDEGLKTLFAPPIL